MDFLLVIYIYEYILKNALELQKEIVYCEKLKESSIFDFFKFISNSEKETAQ